MHRDTVGSDDGLSRNWRHVISWNNDSLLPRNKLQRSSELDWNCGNVFKENAFEHVCTMSGIFSDVCVLMGVNKKAQFDMDIIVFSHWFYEECSCMLFGDFKECVIMTGGGGYALDMVMTSAPRVSLLARRLSDYFTVSLKSPDDRLMFRVSLHSPNGRQIACR